MDWKIELIIIPVSDVERAITFYQKIGFNLDHDHKVSDEMRFVQFTPPGSACSIALGTGLSSKEPGSVEGLQVVVADIEAARDQLLAAGVECGDVQTFDWGSFVFFQDPDGNSWNVQMMPKR